MSHKMMLLVIEKEAIFGKMVYALRLLQ